MMLIPPALFVEKTILLVLFLGNVALVDKLGLAVTACLRNIRRS